ncbi:MAG: hypothetical protein HZT40_13295 [Candidatus Thiothrix singaporensis]|uniref:Uncharacterized protein n=1 Tax=Candidatus Thiothrix singaporensis TaxID=2799669 RepID=A0A7L6ATE1_9GAMM|nr:MAG: hypothetical protein HZT40_13295 [Candidatus Thiothrix singaporensis]
MEGSWALGDQVSTVCRMDAAFERTGMYSQRVLMWLRNDQRDFHER